MQACTPCGAARRALPLQAQAVCPYGLGTVRGLDARPAPFGSSARKGYKKGGSAESPTFVNLKSNTMKNTNQK